MQSRSAANFRMGTRNAFSEGANAARAGKPITANPYPSTNTLSLSENFFTACHRAWRRGWFSVAQKQPEC